MDFNGLESLTNMTVFCHTGKIIHITGHHTIMKPLATLLLTSVLLLSTTGCANKSVQGAYYDKASKTARGVSVGSAGGLVISTLVGVSSPITVILGASYGGAIGNFQEQAPGLARALYRDGGQLIQVGDMVAAYLPVDKYFTPGTTELCDKRIDTIDRISRLLRRSGNSPITVIGHTDDVMDEDTSQHLSELYAQRILSYLWTRGIPLSRMRLQAKGLEDPISTNLTPTGSAYNRYVVVMMNPHANT